VYVTPSLDMTAKYVHGTCIHYVSCNFETYLKDMFVVSATF